MFPVKEIYLEEILVDVKYSTPQMEKLRRSGMAETAPSQGLEDLTRNMVGCQDGLLSSISMVAADMLYSP